MDQPQRSCCFKKICGERGKIMKKYLPEGKIFNSPENRYYLQSERTMAEAMAQGLILEGHAVLCDSEHNIIVELPFGKGIIPRSEGAIGIQEGKTKDIALLSRVNKTVCFKVTDIVHEKGEVICRLSRRLAQEECIERYISTLTSGDVIPAKVTHLEPFGCFVDIGCGLPSLIPIDAISVSRITHPNDRFFNGQDIYAVVKSCDEDRICLSHKELLGTWEENAALFSTGETVGGIVRSIEPYGIFIELAPNLAGLPWELGLAETHQTLIKNGLRNRVMIETDGKLMSGRDVVIAALLGAEEFGFATAPLVTMGCVMMRVCNLDTCPMGIATQNPELRKRFRGKPEYVINFMRFIAEEMREYMAKLGFRTVDEMVGRSDLLKRNDKVTNEHADRVDLSQILNNPFAKAGEKVTFDPKDVYDFKLGATLDEKVLLKKFGPAMDKKEKKNVKVEITNTDRTVGTILGAEITRKFGTSLEPDTYTVQCKGAGGQSFGAFIPKGLTLELEGDSNDYFGKGLSGGKLVVYPPKARKYKPEENIIVGNVALYGATSGEAYINGIAGERFCVRNSGAYAVVEGVGEHGCEYMTGGRVVVLGATGKNFAAGMSGGIAYVLDEKSNLYRNLNKEMISIELVESKYDIAELKNMIEKHVAHTGSEKGKEILTHFDEYLPKFKKIIPNDYKRMMMLSAQMEDKGLSSEQAQIEAFYESMRK